jgi:hypothetical protein
MPIKIGSIVLFDIMELSKKLDLNPATLRGYIKSGRLKGQKVGTRWFVSEDGLREFFGESYQAPSRGKESG